MMEKESKKRTPRGDWVGSTMLKGIAEGNGSYDVYVNSDNHFGLAYAGKFIKHVKSSVLRKAGIFATGKKQKRIYGRFGFVGCPKR